MNPYTGCRCERCAPDNPRFEDSQAYLLSCLAETFLRWPKAERQRFLQDYLRRHGPDATDKLKAEIRRMWEERRQWAM